MVRPAAARGGVEQHVRGLDVPVHETSRVGGVERRGNLGDDLDDPGGRQVARPVEQRAHITAADVPHRDEQHARRLPGLEDRDDVRIVHRGGGP